MFDLNQLKQDLNKAAKAYNRIAKTMDEEVVEINHAEDYEALQPFMDSMVTTKYENPDFTFKVRERCIEASTEIIRYSNGDVRYKLKFGDITDRTIQMHRLAMCIQSAFDFFYNMEDEHGT
jgi:hypothetical protein